MRVDDSLKFARINMHNLEIKKSELEKQLNSVYEQIITVKAAISKLEEADKCCVIKINN